MTRAAQRCFQNCSFSEICGYGLKYPENALTYLLGHRGMTSSITLPLFITNLISDVQYKFRNVSSDDLNVADAVLACLEA